MVFELNQLFVEPSPLVYIIHRSYRMVNCAFHSFVGPSKPWKYCKKTCKIFIILVQNLQSTKFYTVEPPSKECIGLRFVLLREAVHFLEVTNVLSVYKNKHLGPRTVSFGWRWFLLCQNILYQRLHCIHTNFSDFNRKICGCKDSDQILNPCNSSSQTIFLLRCLPSFSIFHPLISSLRPFPYLPRY